MNNPFDDYAAYLDRISHGRKKHKFLLTLFPAHEGNSCGFTNLVYENFVDQIRSMLGDYVSEADTRYLTLLLDFLNTLENLKRGTRMNKEFIELLVDREREVEHFLTGLEALKDEMRGKVEELRNLINVEKHRNVKQLKIWQDPMGRYADLPYDIQISSNLVVQVETSIFPKGWEVWIWPREGSYSDLKVFLQKLDILILFKEYEAEGGFLHRSSYDHKYDENLDGIRSLLQDLIDKLATGRSR